MARIYPTLCKPLPHVSSTSHILFHPPPPSHSEQCQWVWVVYSIHLLGIQPYFIFATSMQEAINLKADLTTPCLHPHTIASPTGPLYVPSSVLVTCRERQRWALRFIANPSFWCRAGLSAKHTSMPCSHEQRWWNKLDIEARIGNFSLFSPVYICSTVSKVTFQIAQRFSMDNSLPALHTRAL